MKLLLSLGTLFCGLYLGWRLEPQKDLTERAPFIMGVVLATIFPIGFILYVKFWEGKPEFSSTCGKQALLGLVCFLGIALINWVFPSHVDHW